MMFKHAQMSGRFDYDTNYIELKTFVKNLKTSTVELTDRIYVDKPIRKQKEVPMQKKQDLAQTFQLSGILHKPSGFQESEGDSLIEGGSSVTNLFGGPS